ncbi:MAG: hypothetical protein AB1670_04170 [Pseudomonadota bacterium]|jgi:hypothetical protein
MRATPAPRRDDGELRASTTAQPRHALCENRSPIAGKPCSATAEKFTQQRLKRRCFTTIEGLFYGNPQAIFAAILSPEEWLAVKFHSELSS